jgi:hypothetical protein
MSETLPHLDKHEAQNSSEKSEKLLEAPEKHKQLTEGKEVDQRREAQEARQEIDSTAERADKRLENLEAEASSPEPTQSLNINRELKAITLKRELKHIQRELPRRQRVLSQIIHQPAIRRLSAATGSTLSRPSGLLGGGIVAFLGTTTYLYLTKHYGFVYNYFVFVLLFVGGFIVGLFLELLIYASSTSRRRAHK